LSAEAYAVSESVEDAIWVRFVLDDLRRKGESTSLRPAIEAKSNIPIVQLTDSDNLEKSVQKDSGVVKDKRLRIVIAMLRQTFDKAAGIRLVWIPTHLMVADALTKLVCVMVLIAAIGGRVAKFPPPVRKASFAYTAAGLLPTAKGQHELILRSAVPLPQELNYLIWILALIGVLSLLGCVAGAAGGAAYAQVQAGAKAKGKAKPKAKASPTSATPTASTPSCAASASSSAAAAPKQCEHENVSNRGSNQWRLKLKCLDCGEVLEDIDTEANTERKRVAAAAKAAASSSGATSSTTADTMVPTPPKASAKGKAAPRPRRTQSHQQSMPALLSRRDNPEMQTLVDSTDSDIPPLVDETDSDL
jgi:hypothetical protein